MKIAVEGCAHGELESIYQTIEMVEEKEKIKIDLLICCGDFQATRNKYDLNSMAVPQKYRKMCSFYKYYNGEKVAPILTLFIGGNHEASNHLQELPFGGWAAPNIYYLGYAGVVNLRGLKIAGISGIYKGYDYSTGHHEKPPYTTQTKRSVYHIRNVEVFRLKQMKSPIDIFLSHDWPRGIFNYGNKEGLLKFKPFLKDDMESNSLGSPPCEELLFQLKPRYWFAAHLHCKFSALVVHEEEDSKEDKKTRFLALDKCLPGRRYLQILDVASEDSEPLELQYDLEWLAILHYTNHLTSVKQARNHLPGPGCDERWIFTPTEEEKDHILRKMGGDLRIPLNFTESAFSPTNSDSLRNPSSEGAPLRNPQTVEFCHRLGVDDPMSLFEEGFSSPLVLPGSTPDRSFSDLDSTFIDSSRDESFSFVCDSDKDEGSAGRESSSEVLVPSQTEPAPRERLSLVLPPPKFSDSLEEAVPPPEEQSTASPHRLHSDPALFVIDVSPKRSSESEPTVDNGKKFKKTLKRRNQQMYTNTNED